MSPEPTTMMDAATAAAAHESSRLALDVRRLGWMRPLAGDYAFNYPNVASLFAGDPSSATAWREALARTEQRDRPRQEMATILAAQQERRGAPTAAREAAARLIDPKSVAIVTGQQAGAFGGPLFTLLKAITALQLTRRTSKEHGVPAVAVFWVDAEDHDWDEVRRCTVLDADFQPRTTTLAPPEGAGDLPVASLILDSRIEQNLDELAAALATTDFSDWVLSSLRAAYRPGAGMADAFARWFEALLGPHGLVVFESADPAAKRLAAGVFAREFDSPGCTARLASAAAEALAARGHEPQVVVQPDSVSVFYLDGARRAIKRQGDQFLIGDSTRTAQSLLDEAGASPARFSPNVLLRPIVQDTLFPTVCYVAGPSELAYLGQLGTAYGAFDVPQPLIYPRASATLVDSATARFLGRYGVAVDEFQPQDESALNRLLQSQLPREIEESLKAAEDNVRASMQRVIDAMPALDPTLAGAAKTTLGKMEHDLRTLQGKVIQAAKRRDDTVRRQFIRAQAQMFPGGQPQERALSVVYFANRYGPGLVDRLLEELPLELGYHWVMTV